MTRNINGYFRIFSWFFVVDRNGDFFLLKIKFGFGQLVKLFPDTQKYPSFSYTYLVQWQRRRQRFWGLLLLLFLYHQRCHDFFSFGNRFLKSQNVQKYRRKKKRSCPWHRFHCFRFFSLSFPLPFFFCRHVKPQWSNQGCSALAMIWQKRCPTFSLLILSAKI